MQVTKKQTVEVCLTLADIQEAVIEYVKVHEPTLDGYENWRTHWELKEMLLMGVRVIGQMPVEE